MAYGDKPQGINLCHNINRYQTSPYHHHRRRGLKGAARGLLFWWGSRRRAMASASFAGEEDKEVEELLETEACMVFSDLGGS